MTSSVDVFVNDLIIAIRLSDLIGECLNEDNPEEDRYGDGYPFYLLNPLDPKDKVDISGANIPDCWGTEIRQRILYVIKLHSTLFRPELGRFNDGIKMPIPFKEGATHDKLIQKLYAASRKDRQAFDSILNPLKAISVVEDVPLSKPSALASPAFIVWKNGKPRLVVDLRLVNSKMISNAYPLPR